MSKNGRIILCKIARWCESFGKGDMEVTYIENNYDPDQFDDTYECTFVYLIRREGVLEIETDRHASRPVPGRGLGFD